MVIAYEPVWAIGTGRVCDPPEGNRVIGIIRGVVRDLFGERRRTASASSTAAAPPRTISPKSWRSRRSTAPWSAAPP